MCESIVCGPLFGDGGSALYASARFVLEFIRGDTDRGFVMGSVST
jgi:hypothetical protein